MIESLFYLGIVFSAFVALANWRNGLYLCVVFDVLRDMGLFGIAAPREVGGIVMSWVASPLLAGGLSLLLFVTRGEEPQPDPDDQRDERLSHESKPLSR
mgnify:CR=1 FL=1